MAVLHKFKPLKTTRVSNQGFIFIYVLIFLQLGVLFSYYSYHSLITQLKIIERNAEQIKKINFAKKMLNEVSLTSYCYITLTSLDDLKNKPLTWWQQSSCQTNDHSYYVIEDLHDDPCAKIINTEGLAAHYFRVTILVWDKLKLYYQASLIRGEKITRACQSQAHDVSNGVQAEQII